MVTDNNIYRWSFFTLKLLAFYVHQIQELTDIDVRSADKEKAAKQLAQRSSLTVEQWMEILEVVDENSSDLQRIIYPRSSFLNLNQDKAKSFGSGVAGAIGRSIGR